MSDEMTPAEAARVAAMGATMASPAPAPAAPPQAPATPPAPTDTVPVPESPTDDGPDVQFRSILDGINARIEDMMTRLREVEQKVTDKVGDVADEPIVDPTAPNDAPADMDPATPPDRGATPV